MIKRLVFFLLFTALMIWVGKLVWVDMFATQTFTGTDFKIEAGTDRYLKVYSQEVNLTAASCGPFLLWRVDTTDTVAGDKVVAPLGVNCDAYYTYGPKPVKGGTWLIQLGRPELEFQYNQPVKVDLVWREADTALNKTLLTFLMVVVWFIGVCVIVDVFA